MPADVSQLLAFAKFTRSVGAKIRKEATKEVAKTAEQVLNDAFNAAPELTGELRDSLTKSGRGLKATVEATAPYAHFVEFGSGHGPPQPYMNPAADTADQQFPADIESAVLRAIDF